MPEPKQEIATMPRYLALEQTDDINALLAENLGDQGLTPFDLPRLGMPAGGSTTWELTSANGTEATKTLHAIVLHHHLARAYWQDAELSGNPPDCRSNDGKHGDGDRGEHGSGPQLCDRCELAKFGSRPGLSGQACKAMRVLYLLTPQSLVPVVLQLPPTSLRVWLAYAIDLVGAGNAVNQVETVLSLEAAKNPAGKNYSRVVLRRGAVLDAIQQEKVKSLAAGIKDAVSSIA